MTTTALPTQTTHRRVFQQQGLELLVSRLAVNMLRWSQHRTAARRVTHEEMILLRQIQKDSASATDLARLSHLS